MSSLCPCFFQSAQNWLSTRSPTAIDRWLGFTLVALASLASREISIHSSTFIYTYIYIYVVLYIVSSCFIHLSFIHDIAKIFDIFEIQNIRQQQQPPLELYHLFLVYKNHIFPLWWLASNIPKFSMDQVLAAWKFRHVVCSKCACGTVAWAARREIVLGEVVPSTSLIYVYIFIEREIDG
jgi:hypothetical protein